MSDQELPIRSSHSDSTGSGDTSAASLPAHGSISRVVSFPSERSLGTLFLRSWGSQDDGAWLPLGEARGMVSIPFAQEVRLTVSDRAATDLSPLLTMKTDDIQSLVLAGTPVTDAGLAYVQSLTGLWELDLYYTHVSDSALFVLRALPTLRRLHLGEAPVSDVGLAHLQALSELRTLDLSGTQMTDAGLGLLVGLSLLERLYVSGTAIGDEGLAHIVRLSALRDLDMNNTHVADVGVGKLRELKSLEYINLSNTATSDAGLFMLAGLPHLRTLNVRRTRVTMIGVRALKQALPQCTVAV